MTLLAEPTTNLHRSSEPDLERTLFRHTSDAVLIAELRSMRVLDRNPAADRLFGPAADASLDALLPGLAVGLSSMRSGDTFSAVANGLAGEQAVEVVVASIDRAGTAALLVRPLGDRARAEAAERRLDELLYKVSHDLRTPLTSIVGFSELLMERSFPIEKHQQLLGFIQREVARLEALLDEIPPSSR